MAGFNFTLFPVLSSERLTLRRLTENDSGALFSLRTDDRVNKYIERPKPEKIDDVKEFIAARNADIEKNASLYWAICLKNSPEVIGTICLWNLSNDNTSGEVGYELNPVHQGKGIMNEALNCIIDYCFNNIKLEKLVAYTHRDNQSSIGLLVKNNFILVPGKKDENNPGNIIFVLKKK